MSDNVNISRQNETLLLAVDKPIEYMASARRSAPVSRYPGRVVSPVSCDRVIPMIEGLAQKERCLTYWNFKTKVFTMVLGGVQRILDAIIGVQKAHLCTSEVDSGSNCTQGACR